MIQVHAKGARLAVALCAGQCVIAVVATLLAWTMADGAAALAALFGGAVAIVPSAYFGFRVYSRSTRHAGEILGGFYRAELGKLLLTALLFFIGTLWFGKHFAPLMFTFMACLVMNWLMLAIAMD